jgi:hypothetical protein
MAHEEEVSKEHESNEYDGKAKEGFLEKAKGAV